MTKACKHLAVQPRKDGKIVARKDSTYECAVGIQTPILPNSVTKSHWFRWPPSKSYVSVDDCAGCPFYEAR